MKVAGENIRIEGRLLRIARLDAEGYLFVEKPEPLLDALRKSGERIDLFTFTQRLPQSVPLYSFPREWDNFAALPVSTFDHWWTQQIDNKTRNMARKAEKKGVTLRVVPFDDALVQGIWEIYNECPVRQGRPFTHFGKDLETVRREEATYLDSSVFIGAFLGDAMIGFVKLVSNETRTQAGLMNIVSMIRHRDKAPTNALVAQAVRYCAEHQIPYLVYSNFAYGKRQKDSVTDFKENNGFQKIDVPRYYVPLTHFGKLALRLRLHHRWVDLFPQSLVARLRDLRNAWNNRKFRSVTENS
ncbi:MAG: hypothetical protein LAN71_00500 [Acidobacteriia bacterium]|nr:hypothetical protein [Terriglobia bacterium]